MSASQRAYFERLEADAERAYELARQARSKGLDPTRIVEIPPAEDLAARVEAQVGPEGVAQRIRDVTAEIGNRELVSLQVAGEISAKLHEEGMAKEKALDQAVRTGLSILTEGVLVAPLEGIAEVRLGDNSDGSNYVDLYFAGPIRAAGGTGQAMSVLIADVVRRSLGIGKYIPTDAEVERYKEEIPAYKQQANLQYTPTGDEIELIARNCPICINGEGTEREEVTGNRDLPRVESNRLRGGACLVMAEGLVLKAPKLMKHVEKLKLEGWSFLESFLKKGKKSDDLGQEEDPNAIPVIAPNHKCVADIIAGRPVFGHPSEVGGFRLRYGRARTGGLASNAFHPASMAIVSDFLAVGTQLKVERPGKGTLATPCDTIEGPTALLRDGSLKRFHTLQEVREHKGLVQEILDLGEILIPYGEFAENNALMPHASWCLEWWEQEVEALGFEVPAAPPEGDWIDFAETTQTPLHPEPTLLWHDVELVDVRDQGKEILNQGRWEDGHLVLPRGEALEAFLQRLLACYNVKDDDLHVIPEHARGLLRGLGLDVDGDQVVDTDRRRMLYDMCQPDPKSPHPVVEIVGRLSGYPVIPRAPCRIGGRMGRPEKADVRKMEPGTHGLFPIGNAGGSQRLLADASKKGTIEVEVGSRRCEDCGFRGWSLDCRRCGSPTVHQPPPEGQERDQGFTNLDVRGEMNRAVAKLALPKAPQQVKLAKQVVNREKMVEPLEKGILRAKHKLWVFKDGTVRFDMTDIPLTHFRPDEIHASVEKLVELGYTHDIHGEPLTKEDQILELRVQDIVVSTSCMEYLLRTSQYLDELLERFYELPRFYNANEIEDLIGHQTIGLAPHTSGGVLTRIIGHCEVQGHYGHPYFHAAKRRNCDGDEDAVMLLLDGLLNFSKKWVPDRRGGLMDLPLVLTTRLDPSEIDKEAQNVDTLWRYPLEFFRLTTRHAHAKDAAKIMGLVEDRVGQESQYEGFGFTHGTRDIAEGPAKSAYKVLDTMMDKMDAQMTLARITRAVHEADVGAKVIGTHFLPDLMGNLKAFSKQKVRCPACNAKYRRMPLAGRCLNCGNPKLTLTVHEGSVRKYLNISKEIAKKYDIDPYTTQRILLLEEAVESLFNNDHVKKMKLSDYF